MSINKVILLGHVGTNPELKYARGGVPVCLFSLGTSSYGKSEDGKKIKKVDWHKVACFGELALRCYDILSKGKMIFVEGKVFYRNYKAQQGKAFDHFAEVRAYKIDSLEKELKTPSLFEIRKGLEEEPPRSVKLTTNDIPFE